MKYLSSRKKILTINDLSTLPDEKKERGRLILHMIPPRILTKNNNKNKRQIEQRRKTMTVNSSYPLRFKHRFLESQESLCSLNSFSSGKKYHVTTVRIIILKGKDKGFEELTN